MSDLDTAVLADLAARVNAMPVEPGCGGPESWRGESYIPDWHVRRQAVLDLIVETDAALLSEVETLRKALRNLDTAATNYLNAAEPKDYAVSALVNARRAARAALVSEEGSR